ncbi:MAG: helix-turn-helix domain-containing protein [Eubacterium sp.]|nr:helix-turn-helix domain-containing protein [Eubacterium sp.]
MNKTTPEEFAVKESGIRIVDGVHVHMPTAFARENLFYVRMESHYRCDTSYQVTRSNLDSFLMFYIRSGMLAFAYEGETFNAQAGDVVLLDCNRRHHYRAVRETDFYWFHFQGMASRAYYSRFCEKGGIHFAGQAHMEDQFVLLHDLMKNRPDDEGQISVLVHRILSMLDTPEMEAAQLSEPVRAAIALMEKHFDAKIDMEQLAAAASVSKSHLTRLFNRELGLTPYLYLMRMRLKESMRLLLSTTKSVEEIAEDCGFYSAANYIRCFRQSTGLTPGKFRQLISGMDASGYYLI